MNGTRLDTPIPTAAQAFTCSSVVIGQVYFCNLFGDTVLKDKSAQLHGSLSGDWGIDE